MKMLGSSVSILKFSISSVTEFIIIPIYIIDKMTDDITSLVGNDEKTQDQTEKQEKYEKLGN